MIKEMRIALRNMGRIDPNFIEDYIDQGGYSALKKARGMDRAKLLDDIEQSGLRGRGGAGFSSGKKWRTAFGIDSKVKYLICNADEGEPGTYKDRVVMENDPHTVIEGMLIAAYVIGAKECFIYVRGEYEKVISLMNKAIRQAEEKGLCGDVKIKVCTGAGAYVCGEETAIISSLACERGEPRLKPPFPAVSGLNAKPTIVNNVETFASTPVIVDRGAKWYQSIGAPSYPGTKLLSISGDAVNRVCVEVSTDTKLIDVINDLGGGVRGGKRLKAVQLGGSSCGFLSPDQLDTAIDFDSLRSIGSALGSGAVYVIDESRDMVGIISAISKFYEHESCGKCTPCREGTYRLRQIMDKFANGTAKQSDWEQVEMLGKLMNDSCFCPLGKSATTAALSAMELFADEFKARMEV